MIKFILTLTLTGFNPFKTFSPVSPHLGIVWDRCATFTLFKISGCFVKWVPVVKVHMACHVDEFSSATVSFHAHARLAWSPVRLRAPRAPGPSPYMVEPDTVTPRPSPPLRRNHRVNQL